MLVILDGCRVDTMHEVNNENEFLSEVESIRSVGSQSKEWLAKTFVPEYQDKISNTVYITANIFTDKVFGESSNSRRTNPANWRTVGRDGIGELIELWRSEWDDHLDTVPPKTVTDAAITISRRTEMERIIVHYMQPHEPFIASNEPVQDVWKSIREGDLSVEEARVHYLNNLRFVLSEVERLLENVDAPQTILTSDHGNAFGEWAIYGHPIGFQHPVVKNVPYVRTTASDERTSVPNWSSKESNISDEIGDRLAALGYR